MGDAVAGGGDGDGAGAEVGVGDRAVDGKFAVAVDGAVEGDVHRDGRGEMVDRKGAAGAGLVAGPVADSDPNQFAGAFGQPGGDDARFEPAGAGREGRPAVIGDGVAIEVNAIFHGCRQLAGGINGRAIDVQQGVDVAADRRQADSRVDGVDGRVHGGILVGAAVVVGGADNQFLGAVVGGGGDGPRPGLYSASGGGNTQIRPAAAVVEAELDHGDAGGILDRALHGEVGIAVGTDRIAVGGVRVEDDGRGGGVVAEPDRISENSIMNRGGVGIGGVDAEAVGAFGQATDRVVEGLGGAEAGQGKRDALRAAVEVSIVVEVDLQPGRGHAVVIADAAGDFAAEHQQVVVLVNGRLEDDAVIQTGQIDCRPVGRLVDIKGHIYSVAPQVSSQVTGEYPQIIRRTVRQAGGVNFLVGQDLHYVAADYRVESRGAVIQRNIIFGFFNAVLFRTGGVEFNHSVYTGSRWHETVKTIDSNYRCDCIVGN